LPFAFCLLPFAFCLLPFAFCLLPSAFDCPGALIRRKHRVEIAAHPVRRGAFFVVRPGHHRSADHRFDGARELA
jgi:hypothetical protein